MEKNLSSRLEDINSEVKILSKQIKNLINLFSETHQKMQYFIQENEILIDKNRREINYLTAQIKYGFKR